MQPHRYFVVILNMTLAISACAHAKGHSFADSAVKQTLAIYRVDGMTGLQINSEKCYKTAKNKLMCIYLDTVAQQIDQSVVDPMNMPRDPYFEDKQFLDRAGPILYETKMGAKKANMFLKSSYQEVERSLGKNAGA